MNSFRATQRVSHVLLARAAMRHFAAFLHAHAAHTATTTHASSFPFPFGVVGIVFVVEDIGSIALTFAFAFAVPLSLC